MNKFYCLSFFLRKIFFSIIHHLLFKSFKDIGKNVIHATFCGNLQRIKIRQWNLVVYQSTPRENMILTAAHLLAKWAICKRENSWHIFTKLRVVSFWCKVKRKKSLGNLLYNPTIRMKLNGLGLNLKCIKIGLVLKNGGVFLTDANEGKSLLVDIDGAVGKPQL